METAAMAIVDPVVEQTKMAVFSAIRYAILCRDNMNSLQRRVNKLQSRVKDEKKKLEQAEREDQIATFEFENWEDDVKKMQDNAEELKAELGLMTTCIGGCTPNIVSRALLSQKAEQLTISAKELYENIPQISHNFDPDHFVERQTCVPFVGRDSVLQQLQELALDNTKSTIGIYGMAGVGKTQLLNKFFNNFHQSNPDLRIIWVDMKDCRSVQDTQMAISRRLALRWNENDKQEARAARIFLNLNKKSFLLILDDVWVEMDFKDVGIPIATQETKSKVIVGTRREDICDTMEATKLHVECLDSGEAWSLFIDKAGRDIESKPEMQHQAEKLVKKCGGLPLALVTIGRAMATMKTPGLWKHAVTALENAPQKIRGMNMVLSCLKRSYDGLDDDKLKTCLLYCTMFPEHHRFDKQFIVDYCIGEGVLVDRFYDGDHVYSEGYNLLNVLKSASMLEIETAGPSDFLKMHPMIRILSHWIESGTGEIKCLIRGGKGLIEAPAVDDWRGVERISLMNNNIETLSEKPDSPNLFTLLLRDNPLNKICDGFFQSMTNLRVLDLGSTSIQEVPAEIGELIQLQHLDISDTNITSLPKKLGNLIRLRYLEMSVTPQLKIIPKGLIAKLSKLRVLYMNCSYDGWEVDTAGQGLGYDELHCLKRLKSLGISVSTAAALRKLAGSNRLANCIINLEIKDCPGLRSTLSTETLGNYFKALQRLTLQRCFTLEELSIDGSLEGRSALQDLNALSLMELPRAKITWNGGHLQNLTRLIINDCGKMRHLLHSDNESTEKEDEEEMVREINALPNLSQLQLFSLPELESLSCGKRLLAFPSLVKLYVINCPKLKKIPLNAEKLVKIRGQMSWWNELEWPEDNDDIKSNFQSIFKEKLPSNSYDERPATAVGLEMVFQNSVLEQLQQLAVDDKLDIIGIYGMAGVGKTTLLDNFFYQFQCRDEYLMIWVDMEVSHNVEDTQKAVAEKLGVIGHQDKSREELARIISEFLNLKNFILILDNVWKVVDLNAIGIPITTCQVKHKIILATRIEDICDRMVDSKLHLKCMEWNEAWSLFVEKVGQKLIDSDPMIRRHATALAERCGGLPLALVTIGRAMVKKRTPEMWENAIKALENNPQQIRGMTDVFSCLKRSFDHLVDDNLRTCLFYCVLLWEDGDIGKDLIIYYCAGEGVLDGIDLYNEGQKLLHVLKANSMLLDGSNHNFVKVHPMIRIFVLWNAGDSMLMRAKKGLTEIPDAVEWRGVKRVLLFGNNIKTLSGSPESPALLTLFLYNNPIEKIYSGFFQYMKNLRVLDLSLTFIQEVPVEIGELITFQYLNLSCTRISSLPKELGNLTRLRFLGLYETPFLKKIPEGLISSLTDQRALSMCRSYTGWKVEEGGDGVDFDELHCLKLLKAIWITVTTAMTWQKLVASPQLANCTNALEINFSQGLATLSTATIGSEFKALKSLQLRQCNDLQEFVIDNDSCAGLCTLPDLQFIELSELPIAKIAWRSGRLQGLISLQISRCGGIRQLIHCDDEPIEGVAVKEVLEEINILPNLQHLSLFYLPELESLSCGSKSLAFPSLQLLQVAYCPKLKKLPPNAVKLQRINGQRSWWNRLEWSKADNMEAMYKSIFVEAYL